MSNNPDSNKFGLAAAAVNSVVRRNQMHRLGFALLGESTVGRSEFSRTGVPTTLVLGDFNHEFGPERVHSAADLVGSPASYVGFKGTGGLFDDAPRMLDLFGATEK